MTVERLAERAVIGALLIEPDRYADVREWLEVDDFDGMAERRAFEAIRVIAGEDRRPTPEAVNHYLLEQRDNSLAPADGALLVDCMQACPATDRAAVYGRMVLESSIRRQVSAKAAGLRHLAERATNAEDLNRIYFRVDGVRRDVEALHQREARAANALSPTPLDPGPLRTVDREHRREDAAAERTAVLALVDQPHKLAGVSEWLHVDDFSDWECRVIYRELQIMNKSETPIDAVTLAWASAHNGLSAEAVGAFVQLSKPFTEPRPDATVASRRVLERSVRATLVDTAAVLEQSTESAVAVPETTAEAYARLNSLWPNQRRLIQARFAQSL